MMADTGTSAGGGVCVTAAGQFILLILQLWTCATAPAVCPSAVTLSRCCQCRGHKLTLVGACCFFYLYFMCHFSSVSGVLAFVCSLRCVCCACRMRYVGMALHYCCLTSQLHLRCIISVSCFVISEVISPGWRINVDPGHWACWLPRGRKSGFMCRACTRAHCWSWQEGQQQY